MKVLLVRLSSLGDVVLATAAVEALRQGRPDAELHVLTKPAFAEVFAGHPGVARVVAWPAGRGVADMARELGREGYDWVADLHANLRTRLLRLRLRGTRWSVYAKGSLRRRLAAAFHRPGLLEGRHVVDRYIEALRPLGVEPGRRLPRLEPGEAARAAARRLLGEAGWDGRAPVVALAPGARWPTKAWPPAHWAALLDALLAEGLGFPVLLGGAAEAALCAGLAGGGVGNLAGRTSIRETAAVLEEARVLVTNDSAPLHLATAVGTPVVALFGPTVRGFGFAPLGPRDEILEDEVDCRPCSLHGGDRCPRGHHRCLRGVQPDRVLGALRRVVLEPPAGFPDNSVPSDARPAGHPDDRAPGFLPSDR